MCLWYMWYRSMQESEYPAASQSIISACGSVHEHSPEDEPGVGVPTVVPVGLVLVESVGIKYYKVKPCSLNANSSGSYLIQIPSS